MTGEQLLAAVQEIPGWQDRRVFVWVVVDGMAREQEVRGVLLQPDGDIAIGGQA